MKDGVFEITAGSAAATLWQVRIGTRIAQLVAAALLRNSDPYRSPPLPLPPRGAEGIT